MSENKIFINESLTKERMDFLVKTKNLLKNKCIDSVWTYDGRIVAKTMTGKTRVTDFEIVTRGPLTSTPAAKYVYVSKRLFTQLYLQLVDLLSPCPLRCQ